MVVSGLLAYLILLVNDVGAVTVFRCAPVGIGEPYRQALPASV
jgi:hypothetical protein